MYIFFIVAPFITDITDELTYNRGEDVTLTCSALGGQNVYYQWQYNGTNINGESNSTLNLLNISASSGGEYTCVVSNNAGNNSRSTNVFVSPYFTTTPETIFGISGSLQSLVCIAEAFPSPAYQWIKMENSIRGNLSGLDAQALMFDPLLFGDEGSYYCNVTSQMLSIQSNRVIVNGKLW